MGKKDKKKNPDKKFALQAKKEAKADKKAQKRLQKQNDPNRIRGKSGAPPPPTTTTTTNHNNDDDLDTLLQSYLPPTTDSHPITEILDGSSNGGLPFPQPPRGNFTLTFCPTTGDVALFGGEFFDGVDNRVFDGLYLWNPDAKPSLTQHDVDVENTNGDGSGSGGGSTSATVSESNGQPTPNRGVWKRIHSPPPTPPPRCSHSTVFYNNALYIFGGEIADADSYHHYKDLWKFDLKTHRWTELKPIQSSTSSSSRSRSPSPRSGHRALVWRRYMLVFGGFFEAARAVPRWYDDLWLYDFATNQWTDVSRPVSSSSHTATTTTRLGVGPPPRSACSFGLVSSDTACLCGGYSKLKNPVAGSKAEGLVHDDCWLLHLKPIAERNGSPVWEKVYGSSSGGDGRNRRRGMVEDRPSKRSGTACTVWKNKLLVYGGVQDEEGDNHRMQSVFYDDLFSLDTERRRWFRLGLKMESVDGGNKKKRRRKKKKKAKDDGSHQGEGKEEGEEESEGYDGSESDDDNGNDEEGGDDDTEDDEHIDSSGWDLDKLRSNMFAFIDGNGNIVYEKIERDDDDEEEEDGDGNDGEKKMAAVTDIATVLTNTHIGSQETKHDESEKDTVDNSSGETKGPNEERTKEGGVTNTKHGAVTSVTDNTNVEESHAAATSTTTTTTTTTAAAANPNPFVPKKKSKVLAINETTTATGAAALSAVQPTTPLPRINAQIVVRGSTLYVYGGILEVGDREVTLDDCWSLDLQKRNGWVCIWAGTMHRQVWKGVEVNDDESYVSTDRDGALGGGDTDDEDEEGDDALEEFGEFDGLAEELSPEAEAEAKAARKAEKKAAKKEKIRGIREEIKSLNARLDLKEGEDGEEAATPRMGEELADFYARTAGYWEMHASKEMAAVTNDGVASLPADTLSSKELKRVGFNAAKARYDELKPILDRLQELEGSQRKEEELRSSKKAKKKDKKEKSKSRHK